MATQNTTNNQGSGGIVESVFGRTGDVVATTNDYTAEQVQSTPTGQVTALNVQDALIQIESEKVPKTTTINAGIGLDGGGSLDTSRTLSLETSGVTAGVYERATVTVDDYGRVTAASQSAATGDVFGPASATPNSVAIFDGGTGEYIQSSNVTIASGGEITSASLSAAKVLVAGPTKNIESSLITTVELGYLSGTTSTIQNQIDGKLSTSGGTMTGLLTLSGSPVSSYDAATKEYADNLAQGVVQHPSVLVATTADITLSGEQTIDGVLTSTSRILVKDQVDTTENGVYDTAAGAWTRASDMNVWLEVPGAFVFVRSGTLNASVGFVCISSTTGTIGVDPIIFTEFSSAGSYSADGQGITLSGTEFSLDLDGSTLAKSGTGLKVNTGAITNAEISNIADIDASKLGDGSVSNTEFGYLNGLSGNIQTQLSGKQSTITGAASTVVSTDLTANRAVVSDVSGKLSASSATSTELGYLSGVTSSVQTQVSAKVNKSGDTMTGSLILVGDPSALNEAATKNYVDNIAQGSKIRASVVCATTANITLSGEQTIDDILTSASRILVKDQTASENNGLYITSAGAWTRTTDMDTWSEVPGSTVFVASGTLNGSTGWGCTAAAGGVIGVDSITWTQISAPGSYTASGEGIELTGTVFSAQLDGGTLSQSGTGLKVADGGIGDTQVAAGISATKVADGSVSDVEFQYLNGVTSLIQSQIDGKVDGNAAITGATKTKITYDAKGFVTAGADATTADIADSSNKRYVTDAALTVIGNTSGTNTGDQNLFGTIAVSGQSDVVADSTNDTLTFVAGSNITLTTNAGSDSITISASGGGGGGVIDPALTEGRLTLVSGSPIMTSSQTAKTTVYFTPYKGNLISLYDGSTAWETLVFTELSLSLSGFTANTPYDFFVYNNSGTPTLEATAWTNDTTRATALTTQDGVYVKTGATTRKYVGTVRMAGSTGQTEFSIGSVGSGGASQKLYVWNYYNRVLTTTYTGDTTDYWIYTGGWRSANNSGNNRITFVVGVAEDVIDASYNCYIYTSGTAIVGIAYDTTSAFTGTPSGQYSGQYCFAEAKFVPSAGGHFVQAIEYGISGTSYFYGDNGNPTTDQSLLRLTLPM